MDCALREIPTALGSLLQVAVETKEQDLSNNITLSVQVGNFHKLQTVGFIVTRYPKA